MRKLVWAMASILVLWGSPTQAQTVMTGSVVELNPGPPWQNWYNNHHWVCVEYGTIAEAQDWVRKHLLGGALPKIHTFPNIALPCTLLPVGKDPVAPDPSTYALTVQTLMQYFVRKSLQSSAQHLITTSEAGQKAARDKMTEDYNKLARDLHKDLMSNLAGLPVTISTDPAVYAQLKSRLTEDLKGVFVQKQ